jgi:hypothetical protein
VATIRRVVMFKHLTHVVVTVLCMVEVKKEPVTCWWGTLRTVWSVLLLEKVFVWSHVPPRWFTSRVDPDSVTVGP